MLSLLVAFLMFPCLVMAGSGTGNLFEEVPRQVVRSASQRPSIPAASIPGLVAYYDFEQGKFIDVTGNGYNGKTDVKLKVVPGVRGNGIAMGDPYVKVKLDPSLINRSFTLVVWIKVAEDERPYIIDTDDAFGVSVDDWYKVIDVFYPASESDHAAHLKAMFDYREKGIKLSGSYHMLAVARDRGRGLAVYLDGSKVISLPDKPSFWAKEFAFGRQSVNTAYDELGIWNRPLSPSEIRALYNMYR